MTPQPRILTLKRPALVIELNQQIRRVRKEIHEILKERETLAQLYQEFSRLAVDKLALDALEPNREAGFHALRVVQGRLQAAVQYFDHTSLPLLDAPLVPSAHSTKSKASRATLNHLPAVATSFQPATTKRRRFFISLSTKRAETRLSALNRELSTLLRTNEGLSSTNKRFLEDNVALRHEIDAARRHSASPQDEFWSRLADVDLCVPSGPRSHAQVASHRRMSALNSRRPFTAATSGPACRLGKRESGQGWDEGPTLSRRRRSGAFNFNYAETRDRFGW